MTAPSGAAPQKALMASSDGLPLSVLAMQGFVQLPNCEHKVHFWAAATTAPTQAARTGVQRPRWATAVRAVSSTSAFSSMAQIRSTRVGSTSGRSHKYCTMGKRPLHAAYAKLHCK